MVVGGSRAHQKSIRYTVFSLRPEMAIAAAIPHFPCDRQNKWEFSPKGQFSRQQELVAWRIGLQGQVWMKSIKIPSLCTGI